MLGKTFYQEPINKETLRNWMKVY